MAEPITSSAALLTSYFVLTGGTWKLFDKVDDLVSKEARQKVSEWLRGENSVEGLTTRASRMFSTAFDSVFGTRLLSFRAFGRSCLASMACLLLAFSIWAWMRPSQLQSWITFMHSSYSKTVATQSYSPTIIALAYIVVVGIVGIFFCVTNFVPDYLSLIKTRAFIALLNRTSNIFLKIAILIADACVSAGLSLLALILLYVLIKGDKWTVLWKDMFLYILPLSVEGHDVPIGMCFYATFFTSFWLWLTALGATILRLGHLTTSVRKFFTWLVRVDEKPFKAVGVAALGIETVAFAALAVVAGIQTVWHT
jgi:hypothetical protein